MTNRLLLYPQEIEVFYILPAIRRHLVIFMKDRGLKQKDIAKLLEIQDAAVSQYVSEKRGHQIEFGREVLEEIKSSATRITNQATLLMEMQRLLKVIRESKVLCEIHRKFSAVPSRCDPLVMGCVEKEELVHVTTKS